MIKQIAAFLERQAPTITPSAEGTCTCSNARSFRLFFFFTFEHFHLFILARSYPAVVGLEQGIHDLSLTKNTRKVEVIHWQNRRSCDLFAINEDAPSFGDFERWVRVRLKIFVPFVAYYLRNRGDWKQRIKITNLALLKRYADACSSDASRQSAIFISALDSKASPTVPPDDDVSTISFGGVSGKSGVSSGRGTQQSAFHSHVLDRDSYGCLFCGETNSYCLQAAHIVGVNDRVTINEEFKNRYRFRSLYETTNGLTLCIECHLMFDAHLCYVAVEMVEEGPRLTLKVADAVLTSINERMASRWNALNRRPIPRPTRVQSADMFPRPELLNYRKEKFERARRIRHERYEDHKFVCPICTVRSYPTERGMNQHMRECKLRDPRTYVTKLRELNTIRKKTSSNCKKTTSNRGVRELFPKREENVPEASPTGSSTARHPRLAER